MSHLMRDHANVAVLRTVLQGLPARRLRVGYGIAHADVIAELAEACPFEVNVLVQVTRAASLTPRRMCTGFPGGRGA